MAVPEILAEHISGARASISRATGLDAAMLAGNAKTYLATAESYVVPTAGSAEAFAAARFHIDDFRNEAAGQFALSEREKASIENARQLVMVALERLERRLEEARPSDMATALGLDWF